MKRISLGLGMLGIFLFGMLVLYNPYGFAQTSYEIEDDLNVGNDTEEGLVSLDFKDANLKDVLKVFSQQSGLNFVAARDIEDRLITLYMSEVSVEDALRTLLDANNLGLRQSPGSNILIVKRKPTQPIETITRVYKIHYYYGNIQPGEYLLDASKRSRQQSKDATGNTWDQIIKPLLSEYGTVIDYSNLLIITDVPDRFKLIDQVIGEVDKPVSECMIEVEVIETTADFLENLGVKWSGEMARFSGPAATTAIPYTMARNKNPRGLPDVISPLDKDTASFQYGLLSSTALTWILQALKTDTNTKFLSKPRILCQDREWAEIKITEDKVVSVVTVVTDNETKTYVERMEVGTILRLVPIINNEEGYISMLLEPSISRPVDSTFTDTQGTSFIDPQIRSMRTVVMAKSGETIAVGGFITTEDQQTKTKVPWLGDIPLLGSFFRHSATDRVDKELLIFITPRIINPTEKVDIWMSDVAAAEKGEGSHEQTAPAAAEENSAPAEQPADSSDKKSMSTSADLPLREQEGLEDLNMDLTLQSSSLGVVDLVK